MSDKCGASLRIADNYGDNHSNMVCQLEAGHGGRHEISYLQDVEGNGVTVCWDKDERIKCAGCGTLTDPDRISSCDACIDESPDLYPELCQDRCLTRDGWNEYCKRHAESLAREGGG